MNTKHTPGPWKLDGRTVTAKCADYGQSTGIVRIATLEKHRPGSADHVSPSDIQEANARLIAAAPELLKLADEAQDVCDQVANVITGDESFEPEKVAEVLTQMAMDLRAAISKATT